jgi:hypothetical protein
MPDERYPKIHEGKVTSEILKAELSDYLTPELQEQIKAEVTRDILAGLIRSISKQDIDEAIKAGMLQGIRKMQDIHNRTAPP